MRGEIFYWVLNMSIAASIAGMFVLLLGKVKRLPRRFACGLWVIPFLRLWLPFGFASKYSVMGLLEKMAARTVVVYDGVKSVTGMNYISGADSYFPIVYKTQQLKMLFAAASVVWAVTGLAILIAFGVMYHITKAEMKDAAPFQDNIFISEKITSPAVYGILRPRIVLPKSYQGKNLELILAHEKLHIRHKDNLWRILAFGTAAVHWFNPFVWIFLKSFLEGLELACDERVLAKCGESQRKAYALSLVECAAHRNVFVSAFGGAKVRVRVEAILSYRKLTLFSAAALLLFAVALGCILLTNAG